MESVSVILSSVEQYTFRLCLVVLNIIFSLLLSLRQLHQIEACDSQGQRI